MKKINKILVCLLLLFSLLLVSCDGLFADEDADRSRYIAAYRGASDALESSGETACLFGSSTLSVSDDYADLYKRTDGSMVRSTCAFLYFLYLLYKSNIPILQKPVSFTCDYVVNGEVLQYNDIIMTSKVDLVRKKVVGDILGSCSDTRVARETDFFYLHIEIDFDFDTLTVGDFTLDTVDIVGDQLSLDHGCSCLYRDGRVYIAQAWDLGDRLDEYLDRIESEYYRPYKQLTERAVRLDRNYSEQYTQAMERFVR